MSAEDTAENVDAVIPPNVDDAAKEPVDVEGKAEDIPQVSDVVNTSTPTVEREVQEAPESPKHGCSQIFVYFLFGFISVVNLIIVYLATVGTCVVVLPWIFTSVVRCISFWYVGVGDGFFAVIYALAFLPVFQMMLTHIIKLFSSFFSSLWKNMSLSRIQRFVMKNIEKSHASGKSIICQMSIVGLLYVVISVGLTSCLYGDYPTSLTIPSFFMIGYSILPFIFGIGSVFVAAWHSIFPCLKPRKGCCCTCCSKFPCASACTCCQLDDGDQVVNADLIANDGIELESQTNIKESKNNEAKVDDDDDEIADFPLFNKLGVLIPASLLDPAEIRKNSNYIAFIEDKECNAFLRPGFSVDKIFGYLHVLLLMMLIAFVVVLNVGSIQQIFKVLCLVILLVFIFPFCMIFSISVSFHNKKKFDNKGSIVYGMWIVDALLVLVSLVIIVCAIFFACWNPPQYHDIKYHDNTTTDYSTFIQVPQFCNDNYSNHDFIDMASLLLLPRDYNRTDSNPNLLPIMKYAFGESAELRDFQFLTYNQINQMITFTHTSEPGMLYAVLGGLEKSYGWMILLDAFLSQFIPSIIEAIVPFASLITNYCSFYFNSVKNALFQILMSFGVTDYSAYIVQLNLLYTIQQNSINNTLIIGQGPGATVLKILLYTIPNATSIVFEGLATISPYFKSINSNVNDTKAIKYMSNIYSSSSLVGAAEPSGFYNIKYPNIKAFNYVLNVYDSFCMTAAQCAINDHWVELCSELLNENKRNGRDEYNKMLEETQNKRLLRRKNNSVV